MISATGREGRGMRSIWKSFVWLGVAVFIVSCGKKGDGKAGGGEAQIKPAMSLSSMLEGIIPRDNAGGEKFVYHPDGMRDPFKPYMKLATGKTKGTGKLAPKPFEARTPLQRIALDSLRLTGIIWAADNKGKALLQDEKGKGYYIGAGTYVGDRGGVITSVKHDRIAIEEIWVDPLGEEITKEITLTLHKSDNEVNP